MEDIKEAVKKKKILWKQDLMTNERSKYELYKNKRKEVNRMIAMQKRKNYEEFGMKPEKDAQADQKLFYRVLKSMRREKPLLLQFIKDKKGTFLRKERETMERWRENFMDLLEGKDALPSIEADHDEEGEEDFYKEEEDYIWEDELEDAISTILNRNVNLFHNLHGLEQLPSRAITLFVNNFSILKIKLMFTGFGMLEVFFAYTYIKGLSERVRDIFKEYTNIFTIILILIHCFVQQL